MFRMFGHFAITREGDVIRVWSSSEFKLEAAMRRFALQRAERGLVAVAFVTREVEMARVWLQERIAAARLTRPDHPAR